VEYGAYVMVDRIGIITHHPPPGRLTRGQPTCAPPALRWWTSVSPFYKGEFLVRRLDEEMRLMTNVLGPYHTSLP